MLPRQGTSSGYCKRENIVPCCCESYRVGILRLKRERTSIYDDADWRDLVCPDRGFRRVHLCELIAVEVDRVGDERCARRPSVPYVQSHIRR